MATEKAKLKTLPSISKWVRYDGGDRDSFDIAVLRQGIGYKYMISPNYGKTGRFLGSYSLTVFHGNNNKPSEITGRYGYEMLGSHKTPASACKKAKEHFKNL